MLGVKERDFSIRCDLENDDKTVFLTLSLLLIESEIIQKYVEKYARKIGITPQGVAMDEGGQKIINPLNL